jgi:predicted Zn-dependent protease
LGNQRCVNNTALLFYKAKALHGLGLLDASRDTFTGALRRKKDRSGDLLRAIRYERIQVYEDLGQHRRARSELEKLYAETPGYEDVAALKIADHSSMCAGNSPLIAE